MITQNITEEESYCSYPVGDCLVSKIKNCIKTDKMQKKWISCKNELPKTNQRYLGYCHNEYGEGSGWKGIVEVYFDPTIGWRRCESIGLPVHVLYWCEIGEIPE